MSDTKNLVIIGSGEFAQIAYEYFTHDSDYTVKGFAVEQAYLKETELFGLPVVAFEYIEQHFSPESNEAYVAVTYTQLNRVRKRLYISAKKKGYTFANYVSSKAFVWHNAELGENVFIFENNVIQPFTKVGNNVVMWSGNHLGHQSEIADHCFISSHVVISGYCHIGENTFIGVNTAIADNTKIAPDNFIGLGSVISQDTQANCIYKGNPAEPSKVSATRFFRVKDEATV